MADQKSVVLTEVQHDNTVSADIDAGTGKGSGSSAFNADASSVELDISKGGLVEQKKLEDVAEVEGEPDSELGDNDEVAAPVDLGEWKVDDPEVVAKFEERYFTEAGKLNKDALTSEFWANYAKDPEKPGINASTQAFLEDTLGVPAEMIKDIEASLLQARIKEASEFYQKFGGIKRYEEAVKWGKEKGYTPAQRARFNDARKQGGEAFEDAVEALMARFDKAHPKPQDARRGPPGRRQSSPERSASGQGKAVGSEGGAGGNSTGLKPFKDPAEYNAAWAEGLKQKREAKTPDEKRAASAHLAELQKRVRTTKFTYGK